MENNRHYIELNIIVISICGIICKANILKLPEQDTFSRHLQQCYLSNFSLINMKRAFFRELEVYLRFLKGNSSPLAVKPC